MIVTTDRASLRGLRVYPMVSDPAMDPPSADKSLGYYRVSLHDDGLRTGPSS